MQQGTLVINTINRANEGGSLGAECKRHLGFEWADGHARIYRQHCDQRHAVHAAAGGNSTFQIDTAAAAITLSGILSGGGNLTKAGPGTLVFAWSNSYTGSTTVNNGTLTTTTGTLGGGPLAINGNAGAVSAVSFGKSQSIASLLGVTSGGGSARVNVSAGKTLTVNQALNTTFAGALALAAGSSAGGGGEFVKSGSGTLEIDGGLTLGNNSSLAISGGKLRLSVASAAGSLGSGVTANISSTAILELAGTASALGTSTPANRVTITNTSSAAAGLFVSGGNQQVGGINGNGKTQVNAGASLTADHVIQTALMIGGTAGNAAKVTINSSDSSGNPVAVSLAVLFGEPAWAGDPPTPGSIVAMEETGETGKLNVPSLGNSSVLGDPSSVPEPSTLLLILLAVSSSSPGFR